jgi:hypothetical protein
MFKTGYCSSVIPVGMFLYSFFVFNSAMGLFSKAHRIGFGRTGLFPPQNDPDGFSFSLEASASLPQSLCGSPETSGSVSIHQPGASIKIHSDMPMASEDFY